MGGGLPGKHACEVACEVAGWAGLGLVLGKVGRGEGGKSACEVACVVAGWGGLGLVLGKGVGQGVGKVLGNFDGRGCLGKVLARLHARLPGGLGWDRCLEKQVGGEVGKSVCEVAGWAGPGLVLGKGGGGGGVGKSACEVACGVAGWAGLGLVLGSRNTTTHHHVEAIVVSMGQLKKSVVNTTEEM